MSLHLLLEELRPEQGDEDIVLRCLPESIVDSWSQSVLYPGCMIQLRIVVKGE